MCGTGNGQSSGASCSSFEPTGPCVMETIVNGPYPTPLGGAVVAGTYDLITKTLYVSADAGPDASTGFDPLLSRETSIVTGSGNSFSVQNAIVSGSTEARTNGTLTTDGTTMLTFTPTCPVDDGGGGGNPGAVEYTAATTAAGTTIAVISHISNGQGNVRVDVYLKR